MKDRRHARQLLVVLGCVLACGARAALAEPDATDGGLAPRAPDAGVAAVTPSAAVDAGAPEGDDPTRVTRFDLGGVPIVNYISQIGLGLGANVGLYWRKHGHTPYQYAVIGQIYVTTGGLQSHYLRFDAPDFLGTGLRPKVDLGLVSDLFRPFYGVGNQVDPTWAPPGFQHSSLEPQAAAERYCLVNVALCQGRSQADMASEYYSLSAWGPYLSLLLEGRLSRQILWGAKLQTQWAQTRVRPGSYLAEWLADPARAPRLTGLDSRVQLELTGELVYDTRDIEASPTRGSFITLAARAGLDPTTGKAWGGGSVSARGYFSPFGLGPYLVLAGRALYDIVEGDVPYLALSSIASRLRVSELLGGPYSVRGMLRTKYIGREKLLLDVELRSRVIRFRPFNRTLDFWLVAFADAGRVWESVADRGPPWDLHYAIGGGLRAAWVTDYVVRADLGFSEGYRAFILVFEQHF